MRGYYSSAYLSQSGPLARPGLVLADGSAFDADSCGRWSSTSRAYWRTRRPVPRHVRVVAWTSPTCDRSPAAGRPDLPRRDRLEALRWSGSVRLGCAATPGPRSTRPSCGSCTGSSRCPTFSRYAAGSPPRTSPGSSVTSYLPGERGDILLAAWTTTGPPPSAHGWADSWRTSQGCSTLTAGRSSIARPDDRRLRSGGRTRRASSPNGPTSSAGIGPAEDSLGVGRRAGAGDAGPRRPHLPGALRRQPEERAGRSRDAGRSPGCSTGSSLTRASVSDLGQPAADSTATPAYADAVLAAWCEGARDRPRRDSAARPSGRPWALIDLGPPGKDQNPWQTEPTNISLAIARTGTSTRCRSSASGRTNRTRPRTVARPVPSSSPRGRSPHGRADRLRAHQTTEDGEAGIARVVASAASALGRRSGRRARRAPPPGRPGPRVPLGPRSRVRTVNVAFTGADVPVLLDWRVRECGYGELNSAPHDRVHADRLAWLATTFPGGETGGGGRACGSGPRRPVASLGQRPVARRRPCRRPARSRPPPARSRASGGAVGGRRLAARLGLCPWICSCGTSSRVVYLRNGLAAILEPTSYQRYRNAPAPEPCARPREGEEATPRRRTIRCRRVPRVRRSRRSLPVTDEPGAEEPAPVPACASADTDGIRSLSLSALRAPRAAPG